MYKYDIDIVLEKTEFFTLIGSDLKRIASSGGGEYAGPCPFCGGRDRFRVQPHKSPVKGRTSPTTTLLAVT